MDQPNYANRLIKSEPIDDFSPIIHRHSPIVKQIDSVAGTPSVLHDESKTTKRSKKTSGRDPVGDVNVPRDIISPPILHPQLPLNNNFYDTIKSEIGSKKSGSIDLPPTLSPAFEMFTQHDHSHASQFPSFDDEQYDDNVFNDEAPPEETLESKIWKTLLKKWDDEAAAHPTRPVRTVASMRAERKAELAAKRSASARKAAATRKRRSRQW